MNNSLVYDETRPKVKNRASSYFLEVGMYKNIDYTPFNFIYGEDNVYTTIEDMYKWDRALYTEKLVKKPTIEKAFSPGKLNDGTFTRYGFGWYLSTFEGRKLVSHGGGWLGFRTYIVREIEDKYTVILLSNNGRFPIGDLSRAIRNILHGRKYTIPKISIARVIGKTIRQSGLDAAIKKYHDLKKSSPGEYNFGERELNILGYQLLNSLKKVKEAIKIFELNAAAYPNAWNAYDSLGEAYMINGNKALAIKNYKKSLELNPKNNSAAKMLKKLTQE